MSGDRASPRADRAVLLELAERCEREEPNYELDHAIWRGTRLTEGSTWAWYTGSVDAALTLVPEGWRARNIDQGDPDLKYSPPSAELVPLNRNDAGWVAHERSRPYAQAKTMALALCAAALRARAA